MVVQEYDEYNSLMIQYEEKLEKLRRINSKLDFPIDVEIEPPHIMEERETLLSNIQELRSILELKDKFDPTMGHDPLKLYRIGLYLGR